MADEAYHIGPSVASESYLSSDKLIEVAKRSGADAIHPGYGFLSENPDFADRVHKSNIIFIGPNPESIRTIGDKMTAKLFIKQYLNSIIPLIPGYHGEDQSIERLESEAKKIEFPVLLKAAAGGGGKGMRTVYEASKLKHEIESAKGESLRSFKSDKLLIEKYFTSVRHVEIQIFGDKYGNVYHINERDCSIQRRHQKIVEETPSPAVGPQLRQAMTNAAVQLGRRLGYVGAGTVEFILDEKTKKFYFLELNTRLQVEHPITEAISGLDLVELQLLVAQGANLKQMGILDNITFRGHAIEVRLCAEDPENDFSPRTGTIIRWSPPTDLESVRFDTGIQDGSVVSAYYDSMIAKIIVHAPTRTEAIRRMTAVLKRTVIAGITTNQSFLLSIMNNSRFQSGTFNTSFIQQEKLFLPFEVHQIIPSIIAAFLLDWFTRHNKQVYLKNVPSGWRNVKWRYKHIQFMVQGKQKTVQVQYEYIGQSHDKQYQFKAQLLNNEAKEEPILSIAMHKPQINQQHVGSNGIQGSQGLLRYEMNGIQHYFYVAEDIRDIDDKSIFVHNFADGQQHELMKVNRLKSQSVVAEDDKGTY
ncbi:hypothetical protein G6F37_010440 [Rhizopus arrhizus]|nr:hypothetical protein G6F38_010339 [Rhizopus arrhizus]KAG1153347.1 hypothetical protein G6F37_010440 [Rhizopus arrhizus]